MSTQIPGGHDHYPIDVSWDGDDLKIDQERSDGRGTVWGQRITLSKQMLTDLIEAAKGWGLIEEKEAKAT